MRCSIISNFMRWLKDLPRWIRLASIFISIFSHLAASPIAAETNHASARQTITVAIDDQYPPYIFRDSSGQLQGILVDTWALWSEKTGIEVKLEAMDWSKAQQFVLSGKADAIDTLFFTEARSRLYEFSKPYATIEVPIFFHKAISGISDAASLQSFTVGVKEGDACIDWLAGRGITNLTKYPSYAAMINSAANSAVRVLCIDKPPALYLLNAKNLIDEFRYSTSLYSGQFHWATRKGEMAVHQIIADGFARISEQERTHIAYKWLGSPIDKVESRNYIIYAACGVLLATAAVILSLLWSWTLLRRLVERTAELRSAFDHLRASKKHFEVLVSTTPMGVFEADAKGAWIYANERWLELSGLLFEQTLRDDWVDALHPRMRRSALRKWKNAVRQAHVYVSEFRLSSEDHRDRWVLCQASPVRDASGNTFGYIGSLTDITERKAAEAKIEFMAYHDPLTALPNRVLFRSQMLMAMAYAEREKRKLALLILDLDGFKTVNDTLGHSLGDALLKAIARRLEKSLRKPDTVCRFGGDEFLILLSSVPDALFITNTIEKVLGRLARNYDIDRQRLSTTVSIGIAVFPDDGDDFDTLLKKADIAMYSAKEAGRNTYRFYNERMNRHAVTNLQMRNSLRRALERNEFELHYQPQIDLTSDQVIGVEALIRWRHPEQGLMSPGMFIPIAEECGFIVEIGDWVLREACRQGVEWRRAGLPALTIAVNLSAVQFMRGELERKINEVLTTSGFDPALLDLELTESILIQDAENVLEVAQRLKSLGVKLSIDDFGTGYSSLAYLQRFSLDKLKIDQSFVRNVTHSPESGAIVRAIIQLGQSLNLKTIAEGVEDEHQLEFLKRQQCDEAQGYFVARPMPAEALGCFLMERLSAVIEDA